MNSSALQCRFLDAMECDLRLMEEGEERRPILLIGFLKDHGIIKVFHRIILCTFYALAECHSLQVNQTLQLLLWNQMLAPDEGTSGVDSPTTGSASAISIRSLPFRWPLLESPCVKQIPTAVARASMDTIMASNTGMPNAPASSTVVGNSVDGAMVGALLKSIVGISVG